MTKYQRVSCISLALTLGWCHFSYTASVDDFMEFSVDGLPGQLYLPPEAETSDRPLILFLHGAGETGSNNRSQINGNIDNLLDGAKANGAFLYAPQATTVPGGIYNWDDMQRTDNVMAQINSAIAEYNIDPDRIYITGLSMGGGGTWNMGSRYSTRFAAAVPIAGVRADADFDPSSMLEIPTWAFHARNDFVITKTRSRDRVNEMLVAAEQPAIDSFPEDTDNTTTFEFQYIEGDVDLRYTEWPTGGHGIWGRVYDTPELYDWLFAQDLTGGPPIGDFNGDRGVGLVDLDLLLTAIQSGSDDLKFDLNDSGDVTLADRDFWVEEIKGSLIGDVNFDRVVDSLDLNVVGVNWRSSTATSWANGDFNGDGDVDSSDLNDIGRNWRQAGGQLAETARVPEPSTTILFFLGATGLMLRRRRRQVCN